MGRLHLNPTSNSCQSVALEKLPHISRNPSLFYLEMRMKLIYYPLATAVTWVQQDKRLASCCVCVTLHCGLWVLGDLRKAISQDGSQRTLYKVQLRRWYWHDPCFSESQERQHTSLFSNIFLESQDIWVPFHMVILVKGFPSFFTFQTKKWSKHQSTPATLNLSFVLTNYAKRLQRFSVHIHLIKAVGCLDYRFEDLW